MGLQAPESGKAINFLGNREIFSGSSQQPKMKNVFVVFLSKKWNPFLPAG